MLTIVRAYIIAFTIPYLGMQKNAVKPMLSRFTQIKSKIKIRKKMNKIQIFAEPRSASFLLSSILTIALTAVAPFPIAVLIVGEIGFAMSPAA
jgi:hypothetical protein